MDVTDWVQADSRSRAMQVLKKLWGKIRKWWDKLWRKKPKKPGKITNVRTEIDMAKNITITWDLPVTRTGGAALPIEEIESVRPEISADSGASWTPMAPVAPTDSQQVFVPDAEIGEWQFRFRVIDTLGQPSAWWEEIVQVIDDSPPNTITNVQVTLD